MLKLFLMSGLTGFLVLLVSVITILYPPKEINSLYGYRTKSSMKNKQTWNEANRYSSRLMLVVSIIAIIISALVVYFFKTEKAVLVSVITTLLLVVAVIPITEWHLKKKFNSVLKNNNNYK